MRIIEAARRSAVAAAPYQTVEEAARLMDAAGVGALVVLDGARLAGIVTDRDIVRRAVGRGVPLDARIDSVMSTDVVTIDGNADIHEAFALFRRHAIRRLPITSEGHFVGMVTVDDLLMDVAANLADLAKPVAAEVLFGHHDAAPPVPA